MAPALSERMWSRPCTVRRTSSARSSILMCLETALSDTGKSPAISVTRASAKARRARMARRVGSAMALKAASRRPEVWADLERDLYSTIKLNIRDDYGEVKPRLKDRYRL